MYTDIRRVKTDDNLYSIGEFKNSAKKLNKDALLEYEFLTKNMIFAHNKMKY